MSELIPAEQVIEQTPNTPILQMIERLVINPEADIDKLERMVALQERTLERDAEIAFNDAMRAAQSEMPSIQAKTQNKQTKSVYAKLDTINKVITPIYTKHGFSISFDTEPSKIEDHVRIKAFVSHSMGHSRAFHYDLPLDKTGIQGSVNKTNIHARASSITYGQRYLVTLIFNLAIGTDTDGNQKGQTVNEEQQADLNTLLSDVADTDEKRKKWLKWMGVENVSDLEVKNLNKVLKALKDAAK